MKTWDSNFLLRHLLEDPEVVNGRPLSQAAVGGVDSEGAVGLGGIADEVANTSSVELSRYAVRLLDGPVMWQSGNER